MINRTKQTTSALLLAFAFIYALAVEWITRDLKLEFKMAPGNCTCFLKRNEDTINSSQLLRNTGKMFDLGFAYHFTNQFVILQSDWKNEVYIILISRSFHLTFDSLLNAYSTICFGYRT